MQRSRKKEKEEPSPDIQMNFYTVCPRSSDSFYIASYYMKWFTTYWTYCSKAMHFPSCSTLLCTASPDLVDAVWLH